MAFRIGSKVKVAKDNDNNCYNSFRNEVLTITGIFRNKKEHPGYDMGIYPMKLYEFKNCPCALYEYEIEKA